jgi:hypothetical protein
MARMDLTFSEIYNLVSDFLGTSASPSGTNLTKVKDIVFRAYRQFLYPIHPVKQRRHIWSFLKKGLTINTENGKWKYSLPFDFTEMVDNPQYGTQEPYSQLKRVHPDMILSKRALSEVSSQPSEYAIVPISHDNEMGTMWEIWLWPSPNGANTLRFTYLMSPDEPSGTADYILGGPMASEVILQLAYAIAELQEENTVGVHRQEADRLLAQFILSDTTSAADYLGRMTTGGGSTYVKLGSVRYGESAAYQSDSDICRE